MTTVLAIVSVGLAAAFLVPLAGRRRGPELIACAATLGLLLLSLRAAAAVAGRGTIAVGLGGWPPPVGIILVVDGLSALMLVTVNLVAFLVALYAVDYMDRYTGRWAFYTLFLLMTAGMNGVCLAGDLFNLFVFLEIATLSSYALVAFGTEREELEAGFKYAV
ncbi:MAG: NADH/ubiquinone/plastoquinone (complex I), partial [bacterium]|nr:NADH/ubiquinone/plastoquinone (complex I) [bacterium]